MNKSKLFILKNPILEMNKSKLFILKSLVKYTYSVTDTKVSQRVLDQSLTQWSQPMRDTLVGPSTLRLMTDTLVCHRPINPWQTSWSVTDILVHDRHTGLSQTYWFMTDTLVCHRHNDPWQTRWSVTASPYHSNSTSASLSLDWVSSFSNPIFEMNKSKLFILKNPIFEMNKYKLFI